MLPWHNSNIVVMDNIDNNGFSMGQLMFSLWIITSIGAVNTVFTVPLFKKPSDRLFLAVFCIVVM